MALAGACLGQRFGHLCVKGHRDRTLPFRPGSHWEHVVTPTMADTGGMGLAHHKPGMVTPIYLLNLYHNPIRIYA